MPPAAPAVVLKIVLINVDYGAIDSAVDLTATVMSDTAQGRWT